MSASNYLPTPYNLPTMADNDGPIGLSEEHPSANRKQLKRQPSLLDRLLNKNQKSPTPESPSPSPLYSVPPLSDLTLSGYSENTKHRLLDAELAGNIRNLMPARVQLYDRWELVYSLEQHGISLNSLYRNCNPDNQARQLKLNKAKSQVHDPGYADAVVKNMVTFGSSTHTHGSRPHGYVMIIHDEHRNKFGCYVNEHLRPQELKRYYGNGECFLWKLEHHQKNNPRFKAFMYTGLNDNLIYSNHDFIAIGSSRGNNGLYLDKFLDSGVSYPCDTFGNEILNGLDPERKYGKFRVVDLEVWRIGEIE